MLKIGLVLASAILALGLSACGGGGGGGGSNTPAPATKTLSGTAATGAALVGATVTLKDRNGVTRTTTTNANGDYALDVIGLTAPFLVRVVSSDSLVTLFSTAAADGTLNVHPFTNLIVSAYYEALDTTAAAAFDTLDANTAIPSDAEVQIIASIVVRILTPFLESAGVDLAQFDLFTTPFDANSLGFDAVLDDTTFSDDTDFTIDTNNDGTPENETDVTSDPFESDVTFDSTTTDADDNTSSSSSQETADVVGPDAAADLATAISEVEESLTALFDTATARGADAVATNFLPFIDDAFLDNGQTQSQSAEEFASFFNGSGEEGLPAGSVVSFVELDRVVSFTEAGNADVISVYASFRIAPPGGAPSFIQRIQGGDDGRGEVFRRQADGSFKWYGNQRLYRVDARTTRIRQYGFLDPTPGVDVEEFRGLEVRSTSEEPDKILSAVADSTTNELPNHLPENCTTSTSDNIARNLTESSLELANDPDLSRDQFGLPCGTGGPLRVVAYPPAGTVYNITTTPIIGGADAAVTNDAVTRAITDEPIDVFTIVNETDDPTNVMSVEQFYATHPDGASVAGDTLTFVVTRPDTFPVIEFDGRLFVRNASQTCPSCFGGEDVEGPLVASTATTITLTVPAQTDGADVVSAGITIGYTGDSGERTEVRLDFFPPPGP